MAGLELSVNLFHQRAMETARRRYAKEMGDPVPPFTVTAQDIVRSRRAEIIAILNLNKEELPITVRNIYYQLVTQFKWPKTSNWYQSLSRDLVTMREEGRVPFWAIIDATRAPRGTTSKDNLEADEAMARQIANAKAITSVWGPHELRPQLWVESRSAGGNLIGVCQEYEVSLWQTGGQSSLTLLHQGAQLMPTHIGLMVDRDKAGLDIAAKIRERICQFIPEGNNPPTPFFEFLAVTEQQIEEWDLESHPDKKTGEVKVELEAISAGQMRQIARDWFHSLLPRGRWEEYLAEKAEVEAEFKELAEDFIGQLGYKIVTPEDKENEDDDER